MQEADIREMLLLHECNQELQLWDAVKRKGCTCVHAIEVWLREMPHHRHRPEEKPLSNRQPSSTGQLHMLHRLSPSTKQAGSRLVSRRGTEP